MSTSFIDKLKEASNRNPTALDGFLYSLNESIKSDGMGENHLPSIRFSSLSRAILYYCLSRGEGARAAKKKLTPDWAGFLKIYSELLQILESCDLPVISSYDAIANFCYLRTRRSGTHSRNFYSGLAICLVFLEERRELQASFLDISIPECEKKLPSKIRNYIMPTIDHILRPTAREVAREDTVVQRDAPVIRIGFAYKQENLEIFYEFRNKFATTIDRHAHFVVYRSSRSDPNRLIKSFLSIGPGSQGVRFATGQEDTFKFVHVYEPPADADGRARRLSLGRAIPLGEGLYLIGGQRADNEKRSPFKTLKVIALPWRAIRQQEGILNGLLLSAK